MMIADREYPAGQPRFHRCLQRVELPGFCEVLYNGDGWIHPL